MIVILVIGAAWLTIGLILVGLVRPHSLLADVMLVICWPYHVWREISPNRTNETGDAGN